MDGQASFIRYVGWITEIWRRVTFPISTKRERVPLRRRVRPAPIEA